MKKITKVLAFSIAILALFVSCATTGVDSEQNSMTSSKKKFKQAAFDKAYKSKNYETCIAMLQTKGPARNEIVNSLDADMLMFYNTDYLKSARAFMDTQYQMQQKTAGMTAGKVLEAAMIGENSITYTGAVYERILAYSMRAVNALSLGDIGNAKGVIDTYTGDYKDIIAPLIQQQKEIEAKSEKSSEGGDSANAINSLKSIGVTLDLSETKKNKPAKSSESYETSAFLSYLGTVIYAANDDSEHAKDFAYALKLTNSKIDVSEDVSVPSGKGRLDVVALSGIIGKREQNDARLIKVGIIPGTSLPIMFKVVYPVFNKQEHAITSVRVSLSNGSTKVATLIEDFDEAVRIDVASKARGAYGRSVTRNIVKNSSAAVVGIASLKVAQDAYDKASSPIAVATTYAAYLASQIALNKGLEAVIDAEKADLRQCAYFPHKASAAGFTVEPGTYDVVVEYLSGYNVIESKEIKSIVVKAGKPTVVVSSCEV